MSATSTKQSSKSTQSTTRRQGPREGSVVWAMIQVLDGKRMPMTPAEILKEIQKRRLAKKLSGKTPEASVTARLAVHVGIYFERPEKGKYQLKKGVTAKSLSDGSGSNPTPSGSKRNSRKSASKGRSQHSTSRPAQPTADAATQGIEPTQERTVATEPATTA